MTRDFHICCDGCGNDISSVDQDHLFRVSDGTGTWIADLCDNCVEPFRTDRKADA